MTSHDGARPLTGQGCAGDRRRTRARPRLCRKARQPGRRRRHPWHARERPGGIWRRHHADGGGAKRSAADTASAPFACSAISRKAPTSTASSRRRRNELGPIDILVHNAGGDIAAAGGKPDPNDAVNIKEEDVRAVLDRNLLSTILTCQAVARGMMERRRGRIVTIGSVAAFKGRTNGFDLCRRQSRHDALHALPRRSVAALRHHRELHRARRHPHRPLHGHARGRPEPDGRDRHARPHRHRR